MNEDVLRLVKTSLKPTETYNKIDKGLCNIREYYSLSFPLDTCHQGYV